MINLNPINWFRDGVDNAMSSIIMGVLRHLLTTVGGALVGSGYVTDGDVQSVVGSIMTLIGVIMSAINNKNKEETITDLKTMRGVD